MTLSNILSNCLEYLNQEVATIVKTYIINIKSKSLTWQQSRRKMTVIFPYLSDTSSAHYWQHNKLVQLELHAPVWLQNISLQNAFCQLWPAFHKRWTFSCRCACWLKVRKFEEKSIKEEDLTITCYIHNVLWLTYAQLVCVATWDTILCPLHYTDIEIQHEIFIHLS